MWQPITVMIVPAIENKRFYKFVLGLCKSLVYLGYCRWIAILAFWEAHRCRDGHGVL